MNLIFTLNIIGGVNLEGSRYPYTCMQQLMELNKCRQVPKPTLPQELTAISTPLVLVVWREKLAGFPDPAFSSYILKVISEGFQIGYSYGIKLAKLAYKTNGII